MPTDVCPLKCQDGLPHLACWTVAISARSCRPAQVLPRCTSEPFRWPSSLPITFRNSLFRTKQFREATTRGPTASRFVSGVHCCRTSYSAVRLPVHQKGSTKHVLLALQSQAEASAQVRQDAPSEQHSVEGPYASLPDMYGQVTI